MTRGLSFASEALWEALVLLGFVAAFVCGAGLAVWCFLCEVEP